MLSFTYAEEMDYIQMINGYCMSPYLIQFVADRSHLSGSSWAWEKVCNKQDGDWHKTPAMFMFHIQEPAFMFICLLEHGGVHEFFTFQVVQGFLSMQFQTNTTSTKDG